MELGALCKTVMRIFEITSIKELPDALYDTVINNRYEKYAEFEESGADLTVDELQKVFQYYEADRKEKKQDYTPPTLARFVGKLTESDNEKTVIDLCAGSGALTIQKWNLNKELTFTCYEIDKKVIPTLIFNLAVRNMNATVVNGDALQDEIFEVYKLTQGEKYSKVIKTNDNKNILSASSCISNPPFNMKWQIPMFAQIDKRFENYGVPPASNANFAFILTAVSMSEGRSVMIMPNGILHTDNQQEKNIVKQLVEKNLIEAVISCPNNMFESTGIGTCVIVLNRKKSTCNISFVDMRSTCAVELREQNGQFGGTSHTNRTYSKKVSVFSDDQISAAIDSIRNQSDIPEFSKTVSVKTVSDNDYNLAPSQYIAFRENETIHRAYKDIVEDINRITEEKNACKLTINETLAKKFGFDVELFKLDQDSKSLNELLKFLGAGELIKQNYFVTSKKQNEFKFENGSKNMLSSVLIMILNMWKQHIFYLNNEENRYLAELRDALLPEIMSGKISLENIGLA